MNDLERDLGMWEDGQLTLDALERGHPDAGVAGLLAQHERLSMFSATEIPDPEPAWALISERIPERPSIMSAIRGWVHRPILAGFTSVALATSGAYAMGLDPVVNTVDAVREEIGDIFGGGPEDDGTAADSQVDSKETEERDADDISGDRAFDRGGRNDKSGASGKLDQRKQGDGRGRDEKRSERAEERSEERAEAEEEAREEAREAEEDQRDEAQDRREDAADEAEDRADDAADEEEDRADEAADTADDEADDTADAAEDAAEEAADEAEDRADEREDARSDDD